MAKERLVIQNYDEVMLPILIALRGPARERLMAGEYERYLQLINGRRKWRAFYELCKRHLCDHALPKMFYELWIMHNPKVDCIVPELASDFPTERRMKYLISALGDCPKAFTDDNKAAFDALPDQVSLYRGFRGENRKSRSWTLSKDVAQFFAEEYSIRPGTPHIATLTISKSDILFYTNERKEEETVLRLPIRGSRRLSVVRDIAQPANTTALPSSASI